MKINKTSQSPVFIKVKSFSNKEEGLKICITNAENFPKVVKKQKATMQNSVYGPSFFTQDDYLILLNPVTTLPISLEKLENYKKTK